jgi:hypothetical protein
MATKVKAITVATDLGAGVKIGYMDSSVKNFIEQAIAITIATAATIIIVDKLLLHGPSFLLMKVFAGLSLFVATVTVNDLKLTKHY